MKWISVKTRLPKKDSLYLVHAESLDKDKPFINTAWYEPNGFGWSLLPEVLLNAITHWMELPEPPKPEDVEV